MRIISKFHDYYDFISATGVDTTVIYLRKETESYYNIKERTGDLFMALESNQSFVDDVLRGIIALRGFRVEKEDQIHPILLLFCGKLFLGIEQQGVFYWQKNVFLDTAVEKNKKKKMNRVDYERMLRYKRNIEEVFLLVESFNKNSEFLISIHRTLKAPIVLIQPALGPQGERIKFGLLKITTNPMLREIGFVSVVDPFSAFQQISMFLTNILLTEPIKTDIISDEVKLIKRGFDKWSFKKQSINNQNHTQ